MESNCLETMERDLKVQWSPSRNLMMYSHNSSGKFEHPSAVAAAIVFGTLDLDDDDAVTLSLNSRSFTPIS